MADNRVIVTTNTNLFRADTRRPELYTVAAGSFASDLRGAGVDAADTYLPAMYTANSGSSLLSYARTGKIVSVHGYLILDLSVAEPIGTLTNEVRVRVQAPSATEPGSWGVQLPLPAHASHEAGVTGSGGSVALLDIYAYNEDDVRADGVAATPGGGGTTPQLGSLKARVLADGTLALVVIGNATAAGVPVAPFSINPMSGTGFTAMVTNVGGWGQAAGNLLKLVVTGQYLCA